MLYAKPQRDDSIDSSTVISTFRIDLAEIHSLASLLQEPCRLRLTPTRSVLTSTGPHTHAQNEECYSIL